MFEPSDFSLFTVTTFAKLFWSDDGKQRLGILA